MHAVGETVGGRYRLNAVIGEGGQATVYSADDLKSGTEVAVKVLNMRSRDPALIERVTREQQAMMALAGTNAVGFVEAVRTESGLLCLVMELLRGTNLQAELERRESEADLMSVDRVVEIMAPIVETLERAHAVGIVHRDLKPGNIFLVDPAAGGGTRLLDFGFARLQSSQQVTKTGMVLGSPHYIAPEMWRGRPGTADARADIYALSVVIFRTLSGRLPFAGNTLHESLRLATTAERPSLQALRPELSNNVDIWVERALAVEPDERFRSVRACWAELLWALDRGPMPVAKTEPPQGQQRFDISKIREWLDTPANVVPSKLQAAWRLAAGALRRVAGSMAGEEDPKLPPPPLPAKVAPPSEEPAREAERAPLGPLPYPSPPPVESASGERALPSAEGETSATVMSDELLAPDESSEFTLLRIGQDVPPTVGRETDVAPSEPAPPEAGDDRQRSESEPGDLTTGGVEAVAESGRVVAESAGAATAGQPAPAPRVDERVPEARSPSDGSRLVPAADELRVLVPGPESGVSAVGTTVPLDEVLPQVTASKRRARGSSQRTLLAKDDQTLIATPEQRAEMESGRPPTDTADASDRRGTSPKRSPAAAGRSQRGVTKKTAKKAKKKASKEAKPRRSQATKKKAGAKKSTSKKTSAAKQRSSNKKASSTKKSPAKKAARSGRSAKKSKAKKTAKKSTSRATKKKASSRATGARKKAPKNRSPEGR